MVPWLNMDAGYYRKLIKTSGLEKIFKNKRE